MASLTCTTTITTRSVSIYGTPVAIPEILNTIEVDDPGYIWQRWDRDKYAARTRYQLDGQFTDPENQGLTNAQQGTLILSGTTTGHNAADYAATIQGETFYFAVLPFNSSSVDYDMCVVSFTGTVGLWLRNGAMDDYSSTPLVTLGLDAPITAATTEAYRDDITAFVVNGGPVGYTARRPDAVYADGVRAASLPVFGYGDQRHAAPLTPTAPGLGDGFVVTSGDARIRARSFGYSHNALGGFASGSCVLSPHAEFPSLFDLVGGASTSLDGIKWYAEVSYWLEGGTSGTYTVLVVDVPNPMPGSLFYLECCQQSAVALLDKPGAQQYTVALAAFEYDGSGEYRVTPDVSYAWAAKGALPAPGPYVFAPAGTGCVQAGLEPGQAL